MMAMRNMMMQIAVLIILLHSFVPHHHHLETAAVTQCISNEHSQHTDLLDRLGDLFHTDLGADHLENLQTSPGQQINLEPAWDFAPIPAFLSSLPALGFERSACFETTLILSDHPVTEQSVPRAPPYRVTLS